MGGTVVPARCFFTTLSSSRRPGLSRLAQDSAAGATAAAQAVAGVTGDPSAWFSRGASCRATSLPQQHARSTWNALAATTILLCCRLPAVRAQIYECNSNCESCHLFDFDLKWRCVKCKDGFDLWNDCCREPCGPGFFPYGCDCGQCTANCVSCVGPQSHECVECAPGFKHDFRGLCVRDCAFNEYAHQGITCESCNPYCLTCLAGSQVSCTSCFEGYTLVIRNNETGSGECMENCPQRFFRDASTDLRCLQCAQYCDNCTDYDHCQQCEPLATLWYGICYPFVDAAAAAAVDFDSYMESGSGVQWEWEDAPDWQELMDPDAPTTIYDD